MTTSPPIPTKSLPRALALLVLAAALAPSIARAQDDPPAPIRTLILTGTHNHDWEWTATMLHAILQRSGRFAIGSTVEPSERLSHPNGLSAVDLFVIDYNGPRWSEAAEAAFEERVREGAGVVVLHAADNAFAGWTAFESMVGDLWREGSAHGEFHAFDVGKIDRNHAITAGFPVFDAHPDELYHGLVRTPGAEPRVLMRAHSSRASGGSGRDEPVATISRFGAGRIFHCTLGHVWPGDESSRASLQDARLQLLLARGAEWAATGTTAIPPATFELEPLDPTCEIEAFRCVLDGRPRSLVVTLARDLTCAWDAGSCGLFLAWGGGVDLVGSVYDGAHGPQPRSAGAPYRSVEAASFRLRNEAGETAHLNPKWRGYRVLRREGRRSGLVLLYDLLGADGTRVAVSESIARPAGSVALERTFSLEGLPAGHSVLLVEAGADALAGVTLMRVAKGARTAAEVDPPDASGTGIYSLVEGTSVLTTHFRIGGENR